MVNTVDFYVGIGDQVCAFTKSIHANAWRNRWHRNKREQGKTARMLLHQSRHNVILVCMRLVMMQTAGSQGRGDPFRQNTCCSTGYGQGK